MKKVHRILLILALLYLLNPKGGTIFYILQIRWLYVFLVSFVMTYLFMPAVIVLGKRFGMLDQPAERKIHTSAIPDTGGIAIFIAFAVTLIRNLNYSSQMMGVVLGAFIIFIVGVIDDLKELPATLKFFMHVLAVVILILFDIRVKVIPYSVPFKDALDILITIVGVVGITNAFNYMDGMNGEAGGLAVVSALTLFFISLSNGARHVSWLPIALVGCCLGFLPYNFPKGKVFLGDNGSTVIGFLLAAIAISGSWSAVNITVAVITPLLIFSIYIFDMAYTTVSRIKNGTVRNLKQWLDVTGKDHLHHRLVNLGFSRVHSVIIIWCCAAVFSFSAFVIRRADWINAVVIMVQCFFMYMLIVVLMLAGRQITESCDTEKKNDQSV
ncbi:glycosyltransferase family 4 protein [Elusimicrobiota bacterium]